MLHPSYTDLMNAVNSGVENGEEPTINSRYSIVIAASRRARQLIEEKGEDETDMCFKPLSVAVDELNNGAVKIVKEEDCAEEDIDLNKEFVMEEELVQPEELEEETGEAEAEEEMV